MHTPRPPCPTAHPLWLPLAILVVAACSETPTPAEPAPCADAGGPKWDVGGQKAADPVCAVYAKPDSLAKITDEAVGEISGLAASAQHPGILWVHNDSGGGARVYAMDTEARVRLQIKLNDAHPHDWEDIALGPCVPDQPAVLWRCLYVADTGDNSKKYDSARIFRIEEPTEIPAPTEGTVTKVELEHAAWRGWTFHWPDGPRNVEAMAMLPDRRAVLLTKDSKQPKTEVWRVDLNTTDGDVFAERLGSLDVSTPEASDGDAVAVTGADLEPTGQRLLVRTYKKLFLFDMGTTLFAAVQGQDLVAGAARSIVPNGYDAMGESVAWDRTSGYWHTSEDTKDSTPRLWRVDCADP